MRHAALVGCAIGALAAGAVTAVLGSRSGEKPTPALRALPRPIAPAFAPGPARPLGSLRHVTRWAPVRRAAIARREPAAHAAPVTRVGTKTPEGTTNIVLVLRRATDRAGRLWVRARLPVLPNGRTGWVPRRALGVYGIVDTHLVVDVERLTATLLRDERPILRAPIGAGRPEWPTPKGEFYIRNRLTRYKSPFYGPLAFGTSARSNVLTDWPGGGFIGIHGTDAPELLPGRVSHGCIRLRNQDILELARLMPVGTPVTIR